MSRIDKILSLLKAKTNTSDKGIKKTIDPVDRKLANLEAEKGEVVLTYDDKGLSYPKLYYINGKKHSQGGTPLLLPDGSFIFSNSKELKIEDKDILNLFGAKTPKTPAELARKLLDLNKSSKILEDEQQKDSLKVGTAMADIDGKMGLLSILAMYQERMKNPDGLTYDKIPTFAKTYLETIKGIPLAEKQEGGSDDNADRDMPKAQLGMDVKGNEKNKKDEHANYVPAPENEEHKNYVSPDQTNDLHGNYISPLSADSNHKNYISPLSVDGGHKNYISPLSVDSDHKNYTSPDSSQNSSKFPDFDAMVNEVKGKDLKRMEPKNTPDEMYKMYTSDLQPNIEKTDNKKDYKFRFNIPGGMDLLNYYISAGNALRNNQNPYSSDVMYPIATGRDRGDFVSAGSAFGYFRPDQYNPSTNYSVYNIMPNTYPGGFQQRVFDEGGEKRSENKYIENNGDNNKLDVNIDDIIASWYETYKTYLPENIRSLDDLKKYVENNKAIREEILKALRVEPDITTKDIKSYISSTKINSKDNTFNTNVNREKEKIITTLDKIEDDNIKKIFKIKNAFNVLTNKFIDLDTRRTIFDRTSNPENVKRINKELDAILSLSNVYDKEYYKIGFKTQSGLPLNPLHSIIYQMGYNKLKGDEKRKINKINPSRKDELLLDGISGQNTSASYIIPELESEPEPVSEPLQEPKPRVGTYIPKTTVEDIKEPEGEIKTKGYKDNKFYKQDINNTLSSLAILNSIKKYLPREFMYSPDVPRPVFVDPERQVQLNSQSVQNTLNVLASSISPQVLSSIASGIVASSSENIANIIGNTYNQNVNLANQYNQIKADILNRQREYNTAKAQNLYDKTVIANQQYDNARREAYRNLVASWNKMITNRSYRHNMNESYLKETPFRIDDEGRVQFIPELGKQLSPSKPMTMEDIYNFANRVKSILGDTEEANKIISDYLKEHLPTITGKQQQGNNSFKPPIPKIEGYPSSTSSPYTTYNNEYYNQDESQNESDTEEEKKYKGGEIEKKSNQLFELLINRLRKK
ncbi:MAG: hypothetical protein KatS3mg002_1345 [Candidatus Woesearchaeota archaeon]|nr:MAG: hypothetical protein KatS3mg002_1345 [Candidatus Woesearchaeota archaeon]